MRKLQSLVTRFAPVFRIHDPRPPIHNALLDTFRLTNLHCPRAIFAPPPDTSRRKSVFPFAKSPETGSTRIGKGRIPAKYSDDSRPRFECNRVENLSEILFRTVKRKRGRGEEEGRNKEREEKRLRGKIFLVNCSKKGNGGIKSGIRERRRPLARRIRKQVLIYTG